MTSVPKLSNKGLPLPLSAIHTGDSKDTYFEVCLLFLFLKIKIGIKMV